ncbi:50S ribosomal protein L25/general stress protein Ctc [Sphingomonas turrisvirgatae]|uniref:Large ribosomal subunit protein bL25 n=1 Tax=Sphingomonas turrisvirgatae TaxID=1888892 RepID=A0A1E3LSY6_9SPHN|nr:50S ribosomal protein L25/general stress protein Ctc [Sphingomonas turrisvirgatae]ODP36882.1 50S ribosomal protein L25/general stress protein Ctc [Sphingomonas turrisvirgatae]
MSDTLTLSAETRDRVGKGASRALRREGRVPAVIYGNKQEPLGIHLEERALIKALNTGHFMNSVIMIEGAGGKAIRTLAKDVALDVVTDRPVHIDFLRISEHAQVTVAVPVVFTDEEDAPGLKGGGVLNIVAHELSLTVDAAEIPSEINVSLKGLEAGSSIHLADITLPKGATAAMDDTATIASITAPTAVSVEAEDAAAEADAAEGEAEGDTAEGEATDGE